MGVGQVVSDTFGMVKRRFGPLLGLWAIYLGITVVLFVGFGVAIGTAGIGSLAAMTSGDSLDASGSFAAVGTMAVVILLFYLGYLVVAMAQYASMISAASPIRQASVGEALGVGWRSAPALLLLMIVLIVGYVAVGLVLGPLGEVFDATGAWGGSLFALLLLPVVVWLACRLTLVFAVVAVDGVRNPFTAIARSWRLTRGHALSIFLVSLVFVVIAVVLFGAALLPSIGLLAGVDDPTSLADAGSAIGGVALLLAGVIVASALFNMIYCALMAVMHGTLAGAAGEGAAEAFA